MDKNTTPNEQPTTTQDSKEEKSKVVVLKTKVRGGASMRFRN